MAKITRECYALKSDDKRGEAELTFFGNVVKTRPLEYDFENHTIRKSTSNYIVEEEFLKDLKEIEKCDKLNIRVNSLGGDVTAALTIHNRLRELADSGTEISCVVDGIAMSAGSMIMCAADKITASSSALIMIHKCLAWRFDYMNADELRKLAEEQDEYDKAIAACYVRKTGKSEEEILSLMAKETYMTSAEAKSLGFIDEISGGKSVDIAACADKRSLIVSGMMFDLMGAPLPENLKTVALPDTGVTDTKNTEGGRIMATNFDELLKENPALAAAVEKELTAKANAAAKTDTEKAVEAERTRLAEIDKIAGQCSAEQVEEAKYGKKACTAQELAYRMLLENAEKGKMYLDNLSADAKAANTEKIPAAVAPEDAAEENLSDEEKMERAMAAVAQALGEKEGESV